MDRKSVQSSNISSIGYDHTTQTLEIEFKGGGVYSYPDVPKEKADALMNAESVGKYFHAHIRNSHPHTKL